MTGAAHAPFDAAEAIFDRLLAVDDAFDTVMRRAAPPRIGFARLYAYVEGAAADPALVEALARDPRLQADLKRLLDRRAAAYVPRLAAAASGAANAREGNGCRISFRESRADPSQVYVIVELTGAERQPSWLFVCEAGGACRRYALPEAQDDAIQMLVPAESDLLKGLRDMETEVFLH